MKFTDKQLITIARVHLARSGHPNRTDWCQCGWGWSRHATDGCVETNLALGVLQLLGASVDEDQS